MFKHVLKTLTLAVAVTQFGCGIENGSSQLTSTAIQYDGLTKVSGLAVEADTGQRFVLDSQVGIFLLREDGSTKMLWEKPDELPELTDLCAIGGYRFVVGANGDGYLVDLALGTSRQHFCLEPGWDPGFDEDLRHLNKAVACDVDAQLIYGQPQTVPARDPSAPLRSEVAQYDLGTGADLQWQPLTDNQYHAGGMTLTDQGLLILGSGHALKVFNPTTGEVVNRMSLGHLGIKEIDGLNWDKHLRQLNVLDGAQSIWLEIPAELLPFITPNTDVNVD